MQTHPEASTPQRPPARVIPLRDDVKGVFGYLVAREVFDPWIVSWMASACDLDHAALTQRIAEQGLDGLKTLWLSLGRREDEFPLAGDLYLTGEPTIAYFVSAGENQPARWLLDKLADAWEEYKRMTAGGLNPDDFWNLSYKNAAGSRVRTENM